MNKENNDKSITLTKMERNYLTELLKCRQCEFRSLGVKTGTIDGIVAKLDDHAKDFEDFEKAENDKKDVPNFGEMLNLTGVGNGKVEFANQMSDEMSKKFKQLLDSSNVGSLVSDSILKNMDWSKQYLNFNCLK